MARITSLTLDPIAVDVANATLDDLAPKEGGELPSSSTLISRMTSGKRVSVVAAAVAVGLALSAASAQAADFTVANTSDGGAESLRRAIQDANQKAGPSRIVFEIGVDPLATQVIAPATDLPTLTRPVTIDGYTQPGAEPADDDAPAQLRIVIDASDTSRGLEVIASDSTIRGLAVHSAADDEIRVEGDGNLIEGNHLGTDQTGIRPNLGSQEEGVDITGDANRVDGNLISANDHGVSLAGNANVLEGNQIGTDITGSVALGNDVGVVIDGDSNVVGGATAEARNLISGNHDAGLQVDGAFNAVKGNYVGTDVTGGLALENFGTGIEINGSANTIGGPGDGDGNVVSGNFFDGIRINPEAGPGMGAPVGNHVEGNLIGTDAAGTAPLPNGGDGVEIRDSSSNVIGGTVSGAGNVISGNDGAGVRVDIVQRETADGNQIVANQIGTDAAGTLDLGNGDSGVYIDDPSHNQVGVEAGPNTIAFNRADGVTIDRGEGNAIEHNSIFANDDLGIDLIPNNPTDNDDPLDLDLDGGANGLQNFPLIQSASRTGVVTTIDWTLDSLPETTFQVEFYGNLWCDDSGHGEGQTFLRSVEVTTDASGHVAGTLSTKRFGGPSLTATATVVNHAPIGLPALPFQPEPESTSEFSPCTRLPPPIEPPQIEIP